MSAPPADQSMAGLQLPNPPPTNEAVRRDDAGESRPRHRTRAPTPRGPPRGRTGGYRLNWKAPGRPDIAYPGRRVAIFVHGCYWHHCPRCYPDLPKSNPEFWARKFELNRERDARTRQDLESIGWTVIEAWECETRADLPDVVRRIESAYGAPFSRRISAT